jgi:hypothetical protein
MNIHEFTLLCKTKNLTVSQAQQDLRLCSIQRVMAKSELVIELREIHKLKYREIAELLNYYDKSGARQAYIYAKQLQSFRRY